MISVASRIKMNVCFVTLFITSISCGNLINTSATEAPEKLENQEITKDFEQESYDSFIVVDVYDFDLAKVGVVKPALKKKPKFGVDKKTIVKKTTSKAAARWKRLKVFIHLKNKLSRNNAFKNKQGYKITNAPDVLSQHHEIQESEFKEFFAYKWDEFEQFLEKHCPGIKMEVAEEKSIIGIQLLQEIINNEVPDKYEPTEADFSNICWGLMFHAINKEKPFVSGVFSIEDPDYCLFNFFKRNNKCYKRLSSHYSKRVIGGELANFGFDMTKESLPASKKTFLFGRIEMRDKTCHTYLKMEEYGLSSVHALAMHTLGYFESVYRKIRGTSNSPGTRRENMPKIDKERCVQLIDEIKRATKKRYSIDISSYGFQDAITVFQKALGDKVFTNNNPDLCAKIESYVNELGVRYGKEALKYQKGDEFAVLKDDILKYNFFPESVTAK